MNLILNWKNFFKHGKRRRPPLKVVFFLLQKKIISKDVHTLLRKFIAPKELILDWISAFNTADISALTNLYHDNAINHQVVNMPVVGKLAIQQIFAKEFTHSMKVYIPENIFEDKEWCIVEWKDLNGLRGCGFFHVQEDKIIYQRGY